MAAMPSSSTEKDLSSSTIWPTSHSSQPFPLQVQFGSGTMAALMISPRNRTSFGLRALAPLLISSGPAEFSFSDLISSSVRSWDDRAVRASSSL